MLTALRSKTAGWVAKVFVAILAASFAVWGVSDVFTGYRSDVIATVGDHEIPAETFTTTFNQRIRAASQQTGKLITPDEARQMGLDRQVLGQLVQQAALEEQGRRLGLAIPDDAVAERIVSNPSFQNAQGQFDRQGFIRLLQANGLSEAGYVELERARLLRASVASAVDRELTVPEVLAKAVFTHRNATRSGRYFTLPQDAAGEVAAPSEEDVKAYYDSHKRDFTAPEFRTLALLKLQPSDLVDTVAVSDEALKSAYEARKEQFTVPEKRRVLQIPFPSEEEAAAARERIANGEAFTAVAEGRGLSETDYSLGLVTRDGIPDATLAEAAFALGKDEVSQPVKGRLSTVLLTVTEIEPGSVEPFEAVRDDLEKALKLERAKDEILDVHDQIEDERASGATLHEIAQGVDLPLIQVDAIDRAGNGPDGQPIRNIPAKEEVVSLAFESDVGVENDPVPTPEEGFVWVDVIDVVPETVKPLDQVHEEAVEKLTAERRREQLRDRAQALAKRANEGASFDELAAETGATVGDIGPLNRTETAPGFGSAAVAALFRGAIDRATSTYDETTGSFVVIEPTREADPAYSPGSEQARALTRVLRTNIGDDLFGQYMLDLEDTLGVEINNELWPRLSGQQS